MTTQTKNAQNSKTSKTSTTTDTDLPVGLFCWTALRSPDLARSRAFYSEVIGWSFRSQDMGGGAMETFNTKTGGVGHTEAIAGPATFLSYVVVRDLAAAVKRVSAAGGRVVSDVVTRPHVGVMREVEDGDGGRFSLFQPESKEMAQKVSDDGAMIWSELHAKNPSSALSFLSAVVGYSVEAMPMGPMTYHLLKSTKDAKDSLAGVMPSMNETAPSSWVPYFSVDNVDHACTRATKLGATRLGEAMDVENVGRMATMLDPLGAVFAVMTPVAR